MNLGFIMTDTWKVDLEQAVGKRPIFDLVEKFKLEPDGNRADRDSFFPGHPAVQKFAKWQAIVTGNSVPLKLMMDAELVKRANWRIKGFLDWVDMGMAPDSQISVMSQDAVKCFNGCEYMPLGTSLSNKIWTSEYEGLLMLTQHDFKMCLDKKKLKFGFRSNIFLKFPSVIFLAMQRLLEVECECVCGVCRPVVKKASGQKLTLKKKKK